MPAPPTRTAPAGRKPPRDCSFATPSACCADRLRCRRAANTAPRQDAGAARPREHMVRVHVAVRRVRAAYTTVVAQQSPLDVPLLRRQVRREDLRTVADIRLDRKSTRLNSSHVKISY